MTSRLVFDKSSFSSEALQEVNPYEASPPTPILPRQLVQVQLHHNCLVTFVPGYSPAGGGGFVCFWPVVSVCVCINSMLY